MKYNKIPKDLGVIEVPVEEVFSYVYLPIKLSGQHETTIEPRLEIFNKIVGQACCDFIGDYGLDRFVDSYVYVTTKHEWQNEGSSFNREGWHSDGFMTDDISYIWSNSQPTIFNNTDFDLTPDDTKSMDEMELQANCDNDFSYPNNSVVRMDQFTIHKVGEIKSGMRAFFKIVISKDEFDLKGNSKNYRLDYNWEMRERGVGRNIPQKLEENYDHKP